VSQGPAHAVPAPRTMTEQPARISRFMFMRVSSFLLSRAPTEHEVKETDAMVAWFRVAACLFDEFRRAAIWPNLPLPPNWWTCWQKPPWRRDSNKMASGNPGAVQERKTRRVMSAGVMQIGCVLKRGHPSRPT
jgi:hypothetical protein